MKRTFMLLVAFLTLASTWATTVQKIGKFSFELNEDTKEATLIKKPGTDDGKSYNFSSDVVIPGTVTYESVTYTVKTIGYEAFIGCNLTSVSIGEGIENIENFAFMDCGALDSVSFPSTLKTMGNQLFYSVPLRVVTIFASTPPLFTYGSPFNDMAGTLEHLYVPLADMDTYRNDAYWSSITNDIDVAVGSISSMIWDETDLQSIHLFISGSQTIKYITCTADAPNANQGGDDYVHFLYEYEHAYFSMKYGGSLTFSSTKGKFRRIVINTAENDDAWKEHNLETSTGWAWREQTHRFTWSGEPSSSVKLTSIAGTDGFMSGTITSIEFTFESTEPETVPSPISWDQTDIESIDFYVSGVETWSEETIKDITAIAYTPAEGDYCSFNTYMSNSSIRIENHGRLSFTHISDNLTNVVITCDGSGYQNLTHLATDKGWVWNDTKKQLTWKGNAGTVVLESDGSSNELYIGMITSITFGFDKVDLRKETKLEFETKVATVFKDVYDSIYDPQTLKTPQMTYRLKVYDVTAGEESTAFSPSQISMPVEFSLSNDDVISITPTDDGNGFTFAVKDYGNVVVTATTQGNNEYQPASTTMIVYVAPGKGQNEEGLLYYTNGDNVWQLYQEGYTIELKTGDLMPRFELRRTDQPEKALEPVHIIWGSYRNRMAFGAGNPFYRAITAGDDFLMIHYSRYEDGDADGNWLLWKVPVHITASQAAMSSSVSFSSDPSANSAISMTATYDGTKVNVNGTLTDEQVDNALKNLPFGTDEWKEALPNTVSFEVIGKGRFALSGSVQSPYELRVKIRGKSDVWQFTAAQMANDLVYVNYDVEYQSAVVIYVADPNAGSSPAPRRAPAEENAVLATLTAIDIAPVYPVAAEADPDNAGVYYATHYNATQKYLLPSGTEAYAAVINGTDLVITKVAEGGQTIPADNAFILKSASETIELIPTNEEAVAVSATNELIGTDTDKEAPANCYALSGKSSDESITGIGFYPFTGTVAAHKAYIVNGDAIAPDRMPLVVKSGDTPTGIEDVIGTRSSSPANNARKVLINGHIYILRDGKTYTPAGAEVK